MAQIHKLEIESEVKCSADKFFGMYTHNVTQLPKLVPQIYESVKVIEGDGISSSSTVRVWSYAFGCTGKERTTVDNERRSLTMSVLEGEVLNVYKSMDVKLAVAPKGSGGMSLVKWTVEYEKANEDAPPPTPIIKMLEKATKELSPLLL